jgi:hypothetical protein
MRGIGSPESVDCEGVGVLDGLSGQERERKQHKGASDERFGLTSGQGSRLVVISRDSRVRCDFGSKACRRGQPSLLDSHNRTE